MALVFADLVEETTATTGTGSYTLAGAATGFQSFSAGVGTSNETYYAVTDGTDWEVARGTLSDGTTLTRAEVLSSSNSGSAVNWGAGTKRIYAVAPAEILSRTPAAGRLAWLEDVGGNPGLPAVDGSQLTGIGTAQVDTFTTSGTWNRNATAKWVYVEIWSAGASGRSEATANAPGGGGGLFLARLFRAEDVGSSESVTVGAGGAAVANGNPGIDGGSSSFGSHITLPGGEGGGSVNSSRGGRAGGMLSNPSTTAGSSDQTGNYGAGSNITSNSIGSAGNTVTGGGGGGGAKSGTGAGFSAGGTSLFGGNGGDGSNTGNASDGDTPGGGGGGACFASALSGAGGDGLVRLSQW